jgi:hypothetical protein
MADFKYVELITTSRKLLGDLKTALTGFSAYPFNESAGETEVDNKWSVVSEVKATDNINTKELILKSESKIGSVTNEIYIKLQNPALETGGASQHSTLTVQMLDGFTAPDTFEFEGHPVLFEWSDEAYLINGSPSDRSIDSPLYANLSVSNNRVVGVLTGDPTVNFNDYRKSFIYFGAIKPFEFNQFDVDGNVLLTAGSVVSTPQIVEKTSPYYFGQYTSKGNNSFQMLKTRSGVMCQAHYPSFKTQVPTTGKAYVHPTLGDTGLLLEPQGFNASRWTKKYHLSPIYVTHPYDGDRGQLDGCIAVSKTNILHLDELVVDISGKPHKQEVYVYFDHNTETNFMNRSANVQMGVAFLKELRY